MIITICASVDFTPKIIEIKKELEKSGHQANIPYMSQKIMNGETTYEEYMGAKEKNGGDILIREAQPVDMVKRYWDLIKNSEAILVLNFTKKNIENYIGGSVLMEMGFAYGFGKKIFLYNAIPERSERMHYVDEIMDVKPIVISADLTRIKP